MEQQTKQTLEMFMSTLNNRTTSEDCASLLLEKIEDLRKTEIEIDNKNVENEVLQSKINELVERNENIVSINKKLMDEKSQLQHMLGESDKVIRKLESQFTLQQRNFSLDIEQRNGTIKAMEEECTGLKTEVHPPQISPFHQPPTNLTLQSTADGRAYHPLRDRVARDQRATRRHGATAWTAVLDAERSGRRQGARRGGHQAAEGHVR